MKLWLDDVRPPPDDTWHWVKTAQEAVAWLSFEGPFDEVSLDHDLGNDGYTVWPVTGMDVVWWLSNNPNRRPPIVRVHSMNPVGRHNMEAEISSWKED